jgi:hypothetical protein
MKKQTSVISLDFYCQVRIISEHLFPDGLLVFPSDERDSVKRT